MSEAFEWAKDVARKLFDEPDVPGPDGPDCIRVDELTIDEQFYIDHYCECREQGTSHVLAEMFALASPPMSNTDREFLEGRCNGNQFTGQEWVADRLKKQAEELGQSTTGKVYVSGLARFPGDPEAWVSGRGDVQRTLERRGWGSEGAVNVEARDRPKPRERAVPKVKSFRQRIKEKLGV